jgi:predicted Zn-dependent protease
MLNFFNVKRKILKMRRILYVLVVTVFSGNVWAQKPTLEENIGARTYETIKNTQGFYDNEELLTLVTKVGEKIEAQLENNEIDFTYHLVDVVEPNAFATGGGYVFVTRGLLALLKTEDELACVMAHEITHVTENHVRKTMYRNILPAILEIPGNIIGLITPNVGHIINMPIEDISNTINSGFDREQEKQADKIGMELAAKAGYNPIEFVNILNRLQETVDLLTGVKPAKNIFDDHPMTSKRVKLLKKEYKNLQGTDNEPISVVEKLDGLLVGQNAQQGLIEGNFFVHPVLDFAIQFPEGFELQNTPVALTGTSKDKKSVMMISADGKNTSIFQAAQDYENKISNNPSIQIIKSGETKINSFNATVVESAETTKSGTNYYISTWIELSAYDVILNIVGGANSRMLTDKIEQSIATFSPLTWEIKKNIAEPVIRIEKGQDESLKDFAVRKNPQIAKLIVVINGEEDENVNGSTLKYIDMRPFFR